MISKDNLPLSTVEKDGFNYLMKILSPLYKIPCRSGITQMIDEKYEVLSLRVKKKLENISAISLTTDVWTDTLNTKAYLGLTGHFVDINCKKLCSVTLGVKELNDRHNADLGTVIKDVCQQWNITPDKITVFVTDNAANIVKAIVNQYGKHKHLPCFAHTINLIANRPFDEKEGLIEVKQLITAVKEIVTFFKHSVIAADDLRKISKRFTFTIEINTVSNNQMEFNILSIRKIFTVIV